MSEPLAPYELEAIQVRHEEATEGPWWFDESDDCWRLHGVMGRIPPLRRDGFIPEQVMNKQILKAPKHGTPYAEYWPDEADAAFIVNAHEDMRRLLAEVDRLNTRLATFDRLNQVADGDWQREVDRLKAENADLEGQNALTESHFSSHVADSIREQGQLRKRMEAAEAVMRQALAKVEHEEVVYLLNGYLNERGAVSE